MVCEARSMPQGGARGETVCDRLQRRPTGRRLLRPNGTGRPRQCFLAGRSAGLSSASASPFDEDAAAAAGPSCGGTGSILFSRM